MTEIVVNRQSRRAIRSFRAVFCDAVRYEHFILICLVAAFVIRICWVYLVDARPVSDFRWYYERGIDLAAGRGYSVEPDAYWPENLPPAALIPDDEYPIDGRPTAYWPVGYSAFLGLLFSVFGSSLLTAKLANVVLYLGILYLSYSLAKNLFKSEVIGRITLLVLALYPNHIAYSSLLASESLFLFLLLLAIGPITVRNYGWRSAAASGGVFGVACLVKPQAILVPVVVFAASLLASIRRKRLAEHLLPFVILYFALGLTILPWTIRNYRVFEDLVFISNNGGINLLVGNNPHATGAYGGHNQITSMLNDVQDEHGRDVRARTIAIKYMIDHPWQTVKLWPRKLWHMYWKDVEGISWNENGLYLVQGSTAKAVMLLLKGGAQLYYVLVGAAFLFSLFLMLLKRGTRTKSQPFPILGSWIVLYFTFLSLLTFGDTRFHFSVIPWMVMYAAAFSEALFASCASRLDTRLGRGCPAR